MNEKIICLDNKLAKNTIKKILDDKKYDIQHSDIFEQWLERKQDVKCYLLYDNKLLTVISILSKNDFDPLNEHNKPYTLEYIYTVESVRRMGYAYTLLKHIKQNDQITAFCSSNLSIALFEKAQFKKYINDIYRYP